MSDAPFVLVDRVRAEQFVLLGRTHRLFQNFAIQLDCDGIAWAVKSVGSYLFACTWFGQGWVFDPYASRTWADKRSALLRAMTQANTETHKYQLGRLLCQLRLGSHSERLLWFIHQTVVQARSSVIQPADVDLAAAVWGHDQNNWPRQWRQDLIERLQGLAWLHLTQPLSSGRPSLGMSTALLTHVADLRGNSADQCAGFCSDQAPRRHHHYVINVGRGFLGLLEQFGTENEVTGVRSYQFPVRGPRDEGPTLQRVGKTGRLVSIYMPARLGEPDACCDFTASQHRLLQALVRETTRSPRQGRKSTTKAAILAGNIIPNAPGTNKVQCTVLDPDLDYAGFNGNGKRAGLGYYVTTPGGWLKKAGYAPNEIPTFLADLGVLQGALGLTVVGLEQTSNRCHGLEELQTMAGAVALHTTLQRVLVRVYTPTDYVERWNRFFDRGGATRQARQKQEDDILAVVTQMSRRGISRRALAQGIGVDPSFLSKLLNGRKTWPSEVLARSMTWLAGSDEETRRPPVAVWPSLPTWTEDSDSLLEVALAYRERGWSVVPQRPGDKKPTIRWKRYQSVLPSIEDLQSWFGSWPSAGLAVVLGPVSNLFVIDVDGPEAHEALLRHLGEEPVAPKAISGSRKPYRYHLFFQHPECLTKAKATPWHPQLEFRGKGGIVVIPPSLHSSGQRYAWVPGRSPADVPLPEVPSPVLAALQRKSNLNLQASSSGVDTVSASPSTRRFLAGNYAEGPKWNDRLFQAACDLAGRNVPLEVAEPLLLEGARPWNDAEREKALQTIRSAYSQPRVPSTS